MRLFSKAGIGSAFVWVSIVLVGIMVLAIISPITNSALLSASAVANLEGGSKAFIEHFNLVLIFFATFALIMGGLYFFGGGSE